MCKFTLKALYSLLLHRFFVKCNSAGFLHPTSLENKCTRVLVRCDPLVCFMCMNELFTFLWADLVEGKKSMRMFYSTRFWLCFPQSAYRKFVPFWWWDWIFNMSWAFQALCIRSELLWSVDANQVFTKSVPCVIDLPLKLAGGRLSQSPKMRACATFALTMYSPSLLVQHSIIWQPWYKWYKLCKADFLVRVYLCIWLWHC